MIQILRTDNPLFARGLKFAQRLCYFNAMTHFLYALPRLIFLTAPLIYLIFGTLNVPGYWAAILAYALPHLTLSSITNSRIQGQHRHSFWNEIYETVLSPYILLPTMLALVNPKLGKFDVTAKGGVVSETFFDSRIAQPFIVMMVFNIIGLLLAIPRFIHIPYLEFIWDGTHPGTIIMNCIWVVFNIVILGVSVAVAKESQQRRESVRVTVAAPATAKLADGRLIVGETVDVSSGGAQVTLSEAVDLKVGDSLRMLFPLAAGEAELPVTVVGYKASNLRVQFDPLTIVEEELLTMVLYSRADTWLGWGESREVDQPMRSLSRILRLSVVGLQVTFAALFKRKPKKKTPIPAQAVRSGAAPVALFAAALLGLGAVHAHAASHSTTRVKLSSTLPQPDATASTNGGNFKSTFTLKDMGVPATIELRGIDSFHTVYFALPQNQVVKQASLHIYYHFSPSLLPQLSHIKVMVNGTLFATLPAPPAPESGDAVLDKTLIMPADLLVRKNQLTFEFVGHYTMTCEDPANTVLWSRIDPNSALDLSGSLLPLTDDLKLLPIPFFDAALTVPPVIPIVFPSQPSTKALQAAGIITSYFGALADYRATRFPVTIGSIPAGNVVVIAENPSTMPGGLTVGMPGNPTVALRPNPSDPYGKVLVVTGGDADQLITAAQAVALKSNLLQGPTVTINEFNAPSPRQPDDAPRWARTDHTIELWDYATVEALQGDGSVPLAAYFRIPPDLYFGDQGNVKLALSYRYNSIPVGPISSMQVKANNAYLGSVPLTPGTESAKEVRTDVAVPVVNLRPFSNSLSFDLAFQLQKKGGCQDTTPINMIGSVLRDSNLDLRGYPHWAALPNLELFSNAGFPFTRMADLRETTVVLPTQPTASEIELYLTLLGHFGAQTGYPALRVTVTDADAMKPEADTDFLVLGTVQDQPGIEKLGAALPVILTSDGIKIQDAEGFFAPLHHAWWKMKTTDQPVSGELMASSTPDTVIEGMESPYKKGRTVVMIAVKDAATFEPMMSSFLKTAQSGDVSGSVSVLHGSDFQSYRIRNSVYHVGNLPWWTALSLWVMQVPWIVALAVLAISFILAVWTRTWLRGRARARLQILEG